VRVLGVVGGCGGWVMFACVCVEWCIRERHRLLAFDSRCVCVCVGVCGCVGQWVVYKTSLLWVRPGSVGSERPNRMLPFDSKTRGIISRWMAWPAISICARQKMPFKLYKNRGFNTRRTTCRQYQQLLVIGCRLLQLKKRGFKMRVDDVAVIV